MASIEVNHQSLREAASAIKEYCTEQDKQMKNADSAVKMMLSSNWTGGDSSEFGRMWGGVNVDGSVARQLKKNLEDFSDALNASAEAYRSAQEKAYNAASSLPKFLV